MTTAALFTPLTLGPVEVSNRIAVAPMCQYSAENGQVTDWHRMHVLQYAISGAGLFMLEATGVTADGRITPFCLALDRDEQETALRDLVATCRHYGAAKMGIQLNHSGRKGSSDAAWRGGSPVTPQNGGWVTHAPSALALGQAWPTPVAYSEADLQHLLVAYRNATERSVRAGFDVVEIHAAHGYLLHQFLSPISNHRQDGYGGDAARRARFPLAVVEAVRKALPHDRALGIRVSATDWVAEGLQINEVIAFLVQAKAMGVDYVCVSSGGIRPDIRIPIGPGYQVELAAQIRRETGLITRAVGLITEADQAEKILQAGHADQVAIARGFLDDPRWVWHAADRLGATVVYPPPYERASRPLWPGFRHRNAT